MSKGSALVADSNHNGDYRSSRSWPQRVNSNHGRKPRPWQRRSRKREQDIEIERELGGDSKAAEEAGEAVGGTTMVVAKLLLQQPGAAMVAGSKHGRVGRDGSGSWEPGDGRRWCNRPPKRLTKA